MSECYIDNIFGLKGQMIEQYRKVHSITNTLELFTDYKKTFQKHFKNVLMSIIFLNISKTLSLNKCSLGQIKNLFLLDYTIYNTLKASIENK